MTFIDLILVLLTPDKYRGYDHGWMLAGVEVLPEFCAMLERGEHEDEHDGDGGGVM